MKDNKITTIAILALAIALIVLAFNFNTSTTQDDNVISVSGTAEMTALADQATIYIEIATKGDSVLSVENENTQTANNILNEMKKLVGEENVETDSYRINEEKDWQYEKGEYEFKGYIATHRIKVTTTNLAEIGNIINKATELGATGINNINFELQKETEEKVRSEALEKAVNVANKKANTLASSTNVKLGKVSKVSENNFYYTPFSYANVREDMLANDGSGASAEFGTQKVKISSSVSVEYEIKN